MRSIRSCRAIVALAIAMLCSGDAAAAVAAGEPQFTAAGIDPQDRFVAAWTLAPGTSFDSIEFATSSLSDPASPGFFAGGNFADFGCVRPAEGCESSPAATSYRAPYAIARDRRYFARVSAKGGRGVWLSSPVWVIDETRPLIPGRPPSKAGGPGMGVAALGHLFRPPPPETLRPPKLQLRAPKSIGAYARRGVHVKLTCPDSDCFVQLRVRLGQATLTARNYTLAPGRPETYDMRPEGPHLRHRRSARVRFLAVIFQPGAKKTRIARSFTVRR